MIINFQGFGHFVDGINNQDCALETERMLLVLDGCSGAKYAEVGTRLFTQLFARKEGYDKLENFELNIKETFEEMLEVASKYYVTPDLLESEFIMENMLFTIIALFDCENKYVAKIFGDGYIITQNNMDNISYLKFSYGKYPPYYAYKYCKNMGFDEKDFKTYEFGKDKFKKLFIGTDGVMPLVKGEIDGADKIIGKNDLSLASTIKANRQKFYDDVTIGRIGK